MMKTSPALVCQALSLFLIVGVSIAHGRTFTNASGTKVEAEVVQLEGEMVTLRVARKEFTVPVAKLSQADQQYLEQWRKQEVVAELSAVPQGEASTIDPAILLKPLDLSGTEEASGLIIPRDSEGLYLRNDQGQVEVVWTPETRIALMANTRQFGKGLKADRLEHFK